MVGGLHWIPWVPTICYPQLSRVPGSSNFPSTTFRLSVRAASSVSSTYNEEDVARRITLASSIGSLDLSDCGLLEVPPQVFQLGGLVDLSLAGNNIDHLPDDIQNLRNLRRLGLAGNFLQELPPAIGKLRQLEGLWVHGNTLQTLPDEIGELGQLRMLALAGNKLSALPETIAGLVNVQTLSVAGNLLREIPRGISCLQKLRVLALYGNKLSAMPESLTQLPTLEDLWLQGNDIESLPTDLSGLKSLKQFSLADNILSDLPDSIGQLQTLETLWLYGNMLQRIPSSLGSLHKLAHLWLEGNPLDARSLQEALPGLAHLKNVGVSCDIEPSEKNLSVSKVAGSGLAPSSGGYFKLYSEGVCKVVVVAFGSAPCVPNWGRLLRKVRKSMEAGVVAPSFDILYVVDSCRSWYTHDSFQRQPKTVASSDPQERTRRKPGWYYRQELEAALKNYDRVFMLGDSMGASAALLFSDLATSVIALCPQVDLTTSSIRPGEDKPWLQQYKEAILESVMSSGAKISVHCGSWSHDVEQVKILPCKKVNVVVHNVDDHRLAKELDSAGTLLSLVQSEIEQEISQCVANITR